MQIFTGEIPFHRIQQPDTIRLVVYRRQQPTRPANSAELGLSDTVWELMRQCWNPDFSKRPTAQYFLEQLPGGDLSHNLPLRKCSGDAEDKKILSIATCVISTSELELSP